MLSAKDGEYDLADAFDIGADDYLTKPFSFVVLVARLRALLRRGAPERPTVLTAGTLSLDPARRRVTRGQTALTLTPREYGVLEFLLRNKGDVVTKSEILRSVWDSNYEGDDNVVEVYIGYLRRKIDVPFGVVTIETVRGAGYRLLDAMPALKICAGRVLLCQWQCEGEHRAAVRPRRPLRRCRRGTARFARRWTSRGPIPPTSGYGWGRGERTVRRCGRGLGPGCRVRRRRS